MMFWLHIVAGLAWAAVGFERVHSGKPWRGVCCLLGAAILFGMAWWQA